jgi:hypothetical protein
MKVISKPECGDWLKANIGSDVTVEKVEEDYPYGVAYRLPSDTGKKTALLTIGPAPWDADSSNLTGAESARLGSYGSGPHIPPRSGELHATPSTNWFRNPELPARVSAPARSSSDLPHSGGACVRRVLLSSDRRVPPFPVAAPSGSPTADVRRPAAPPRTDGLPFSTAAPPASAAAPVLESLAELLPGFP